LLIAALDPLWMSLGFGNMGYNRLIFQVLYAIGASMVCMAGLRRLPSSALLAGGIGIQFAGELTKLVHPSAQPWQALWAFLFVGGEVGRAVCAYPLVPWLSFMMIGWALGRWLLVPQPRGSRVRVLMLGSAGLLALFVLVRGIDGYGNWDLHRDSSSVLQWLHVSKYPPSVSYGGLELGIALLVLAAFVAIDDPEQPRVAFAGLGLLGGTAFFYYVIHVHLMRAAEAVLGLDRHVAGLAKTWGAAAVVLVLLLAPCAWWRWYKRAHPDGWTRYV
jgi:uncharacterized membrane protein